MNQSKAEKGYDSLAPWYQFVERLRFGGTLQRARTALLSKISEPKTALFLGEGDGRLLREFARQFPSTHIVSIDLSEQMLKLQKKRLESVVRANVGTITWVHRDARSLEFPDSSFELIIAPFSLDVFCETDLQQILRKLSTWLTAGGQLYVVDFRQPESGVKFIWAKFWLAIMHLFFRWQTALEPRKLCNLQALAERVGFQLETERRSHFDMIFSAIYRRELERP